MLLQELTDCLETWMPLQDAESWDNVGLLIGDAQQSVRHVLCTIDYTPDVAAEAARLGCDTILAYHPPWFKSLKRLTAPHPLYDAARRGLAIYSPHTAMDVAPGGTNDVLAEAMKLTQCRPLRLAVSSAREPPSRGIGRIGHLDRVPLNEVVQRLTAGMGVQHALLAAEVGKPAAPVSCVAVCAGAGGDLLADALRQGADLFVTGELRHHDALRALAHGLRVVALLHSASERAALMPLVKRLQTQFNGLVVTQSAADADPFVFV